MVLVSTCWLLGFLNARAGTLPAGWVVTCAPNLAVTAGPYVVQTNYWNRSVVPGTQCLSINRQNGDFTVTRADYDGGVDNVAAFPCILYGCAFGTCSPDSDLPMRLDDLKSIVSDWRFTPTPSGIWNAAYDLWICPDHSCGPSGFNGGLEVMVWLEDSKVPGWQYDLGPVTVAGASWELWHAQFTIDNNHWDYVAYLPPSPVTSVSGFDLKPFLDETQSKGFVHSTEFLYAVQAGVEIHAGGVPFTSRNFSVSIQTKTQGAGDAK